MGVDADDAQCRDAIALARGDSRPLPVDLSGGDLWRDGARRLYARAGRRPQQLARGDARRPRLAPVLGAGSDLTCPDPAPRHSPPPALIHTNPIANQTHPP